MKKCFFISTKHSVFMEPVRRAFMRAGFDVQFADYRGSPFLAAGGLARRLWSRAPNRVASSVFQWAQQRVNKNILEAAEDFRPDLIFVIKGKELGVTTLSSLGEIAPLANWYPETVDHWGGIIDAALHCKYFFTFDDMVIEMLAKKGLNSAYYLPFCADVSPATEWPQENAEPEYNVTFIGTYHPERFEREHILAQVADLGLNIWGGEAWKNTSLSRYYRGVISNDKMLRVYRSSRIVINHYLTGWPGSGINLRPFEVTGAGALLLNHDSRQDIFRHFQDGQEFVSFSGRDDIRAKVSYYLNNEAERRRIARNGFLRTQNEHTYDLRVQKVLQIMNI